MRRALDLATGALVALAYFIGRGVRAVRRLLARLRPARFAVGRFLCRSFGHPDPARVGTVTLRGWRPCPLFVCPRCGAAWRGVRS